jgi:hypothetical protein
MVPMLMLHSIEKMTSPKSEYEMEFFAFFYGLSSFSHYKTSTN